MGSYKEAKAIQTIINKSSKWAISNVEKAKTYAANFKEVFTLYDPATETTIDAK